MQKELFNKFHEEWALVTAGSLSFHNSMTISWGEMGTLWNKSVVTVYIKPARYTHQFMEENDKFVVSFFPHKYRSALSTMGSISGKDVNKDEVSGLTPYEYKGVTLYKEAYKSIILKKIYQNDLILDNIPEEHRLTHYLEQAPHTMYIGEVVEIVE